LTEDRVFEADVVIIGTGAGGGFSAESLTRAGLNVVMVEEGAYETARTFSQNEAVATAMLYQQGGAQRTKDHGILVLQGRCVGGGTTINWTTSLHTPAHTLAHWQDAYGLSAMAEAELAPYFDAAGTRLNIHEWNEVPPNENNLKLAKGAEALGIEWSLVPRNVKGCGNTGLCGYGCPLNAKQSQMVTTIPWSLDHGAMLIVRGRAKRLVHDGARVSELRVAAMDAAGLAETGHRLTLRARHFVVSAGAIRSPALLMASGVPDPSGMTGKRTFLHPVVPVIGDYADPVEGFHGAPQSIYSHQFLAPQPDRMGFKLETLPTSNLIVSTFLDKRIGTDHAQRMRRLPHLSALNALHGDGFHEGEACGTVELTDSGPALDYPITDLLMRSARHAIEVLSELHFAAGAQKVSCWNLNAPDFTDMAQLRDWLTDADMGPLRQLYGSAHVMGGCRMGTDETQGVVDTDGRHFAIGNLSVHDGSIFPTSVGLNPQFTIYATALRNAQKLAADLT
ncbi:MAG: GMC family oxidoreductase N-terminal domain-containing protein, partial [Paracoccus sp. (in: a-proteobacteria)]